MGHAAGETPLIRSHEPPGRVGARPLTPSVHPGSNRGRAARGQGTGHRSFVGASADAPTTHLGRNRPHLRLGEDGVSAGAKIPIMPVEKSPPPYVVNRSSLRTEEVPRLVTGER